LFVLFNFLTIKGKSISKLGESEKFEGDIVLNEKTKKIVEGENTFDAIASQAKKWPGAVVPYVFDYYFDTQRRSVVQQAINEFNMHTCIKFVPRSNQANYVRFMIGGGCYSQIGMAGYSQDISIGNNCNYKGIVMHEMMHAVGFWHEQSRLDRDNYITIYWNNIQRSPSDMSYNFRKYSHGEADYYGELYDYDSLMHYDNYAFSSNGYATIVSRKDPNKRLGQRNGFSAIDIKQLNKLYCGGGSSCVDNNTYCSYWASIGECSKNPNYMHVYCKKSCQKC